MNEVRGSDGRVGAGGVRGAAHAQHVAVPSRRRTSSALAACAALHTLNISGCEKVGDVSALAGCAALRELNIAGCDRTLRVPAALSDNVEIFSNFYGEPFFP